MTVNRAVLLRLLLVSVMLLLLYPPFSFAAEYYVDGENGSDANDGSSASPWKTIGHALTPGPQSPSGTDTIYIRYSTYDEALDFKPVDKHSLTVKGVAQSGNMPVIDANGDDYAVELKDFNGIIQGLEILGARHGVNIAGESNNAKITGCKIHSNVKGVHVSNISTPLISGNFIYSNDECGIGVMSDSAPTIAGNQIYHNGNGNPTEPSAGICIPDNATPGIYNNIIRNNYNAGIIVLDNAAPVIVNNTIAHHRGDQDSPGRAIKIVHDKDEPIPSVKIANNIIYDSDYGLFSKERIRVVGNEYNNFWLVDEKYVGFESGSHEISTDPLFAYNYNLNSESLCIDAGTPSSAPTTDILGVHRPQGNGFDMGAYEHRLSDKQNPIGQQGFSPALFLLL